MSTTFFIFMHVSRIVVYIYAYIHTIFMVLCIMAE